MTRSGMAATLRAVLYSGFFWKREEFSRVETSSIFARQGQLGGGGGGGGGGAGDRTGTFVRLFELWLGGGG